SSLGGTLGWRPFAPGGCVVRTISPPLASSDSRSARPRFAAQHGVSGLSLPAHLPTGCRGLHSWDGDGSLLVPHRLAHHSMPSTPPGSLGPRLQALHPVPGLRPHNPGSDHLDAA